MSLRISALIFSLLFVLQCSSELVLKNTQDVLDLLEDSNSNAKQGVNNSSSSSSGNSSSGGQNLDYYGLTDSPTGTNTSGATGSPAGGNPLGR